MKRHSKRSKPVSWNRFALTSRSTILSSVRNFTTHLYLIGQKCHSPLKTKYRPSAKKTSCISIISATLGCAWKRPQCLSSCWIRSDDRNFTWSGQNANWKIMGFSFLRLRKIWNGYWFGASSIKKSIMRFVNSELLMNGSRSCARKWQFESKKRFCLKNQIVRTPSRMKLARSCWIICQSTPQRLWWKFRKLKDLSHKGSTGKLSPECLKSKSLMLRLCDRLWWASTRGLEPLPLGLTLEALLSVIALQMSLGRLHTSWEVNNGWKTGKWLET